MPGVSLIDGHIDAPKLTFDEAIDQELICNGKYCPYFKQNIIGTTCEGRWCEEAWANYCEVHGLSIE